MSRTTTWSVSACSARRLAISKPTAGCTMALRSASAWGSAKTIGAMVGRSVVPKRATTASCAGPPGSTTSRAMRSASTITAPRSASSAATVDLPEPMPPVSPRTSTRLFGGGGRLLGGLDRLGGRGLGSLGGLDGLGGRGTKGLCLLHGLAGVRVEPVLGGVVGPGSLRLVVRRELGAHGRADVVALLVVGMLAEVLAVLGRHLAALGRLLDRQADATAGQVDVDDLHPQLLARGDDLLGQVDVVHRRLGAMD